MKQQLVLFSYVLLLSYFLASGDLIPQSKQSCLHGGVSCSSPASPCQELHICEKELKNVARPSRELEDDDMVEQMRSEECDEKDQECFGRRMIAEAHLDYIYTQHQNP